MGFWVGVEWGKNVNLLINQKIICQNLSDPGQNRVDKTAQGSTACKGGLLETPCMLNNKEKM